MALSCAHAGRVMTISPPPALRDECALYRAVAWAVRLARGGGSVWMWGPFTDWFQQWIGDAPTLHRVVPDVEFSFKRGQPNRGFYASAPEPHFWGALLLDFANVSSAQGTLAKEEMVLLQQAMKESPHLDRRMIKC